jgi:hypothetical protein
LLEYGKYKGFLMKKLTPLIVLGIFLIAVVFMIFGMKNASDIVHPSYKTDNKK